MSTNRRMYLPAIVAMWVVLVLTGCGGSGGDSVGPGDYQSPLVEWIPIEDQDLGMQVGIEHEEYGLRAWYTIDGGGWVPHISGSAPEHQPTESATWVGEWAGYYGHEETIRTGAARVTVTLGTSSTDATLAYDDIPTLGKIQTDRMPISDGGFTGTIYVPDSGTYWFAGQFGGPDQAGVVGYAAGGDLLSVFYGER